MSERVFLHVGLPKSGTTYLQAVLEGNKARLAEHVGLLFPGASWADQVQAVRDVRGAKGRDVVKGESSGAWSRLVDEIAAWDGDAVVSMEWLGGATTGQARRIVSSLAPARVEVILTVRDLARTIPAAWQEFMQNWETWSWSEFLRAISSETPMSTKPGSHFWSQQDLGKILANWRDAVAAEQLHVVTLPQSGAPAGELWSRFSTVLGIDAASFDASGKGTNESLGRESAELMVRLNRVSRAHGMEWRTYNEMFKAALAKKGLAKRKHVESPLYRIPSELQEWTVARSAEQARAVVASGAHVVGSLSDLEPAVAPADSASQDVQCEAVLDAAIEGMVAIAQDRGRELTKLRRRNAALARDNDDLRRTVGARRGTSVARAAYRVARSAVRRVMP